MPKTALVVCLLVAVALLLSACGGAPSEAEQPLEERILARWQHMIDRDFGQAWDFYSPGFRQANPRDDFARDMLRRPIRWLEVDLHSVECDEDVCDVVISLVYQPVAAPAGLRSIRVPTRAEERWIKIDGQWWFVAG